MGKLTGAEAARLYAAAKQFVEQALREDNSLFTLGPPVWSAPVIADLAERFVRRPDARGDDFETKFSRQLAGAPPRHRSLGRVGSGGRFRKALIGALGADRDGGGRLRVCLQRLGLQSAAFSRLAPVAGAFGISRWLSCVSSSPPQLSPDARQQELRLSVSCVGS